MAKKPASKTKPESNGVLPKLKAVYEFMTQNNLDSLELNEAGMHLKMVRRKANQVQVPVMVPMAGTVAQAAVPAAGNPSIPNATAAAAPVNGTTIKSGMMGIFYRAASPSSPPFIKEGDHVKAGQVLCMIEAMKVFNEIKAEYPCTVIKTLLENGKPVKSGQDLFLVQR